MTMSTIYTIAKWLGNSLPLRLSPTLYVWMGMPGASPWTWFGTTSFRRKRFLSNSSLSAIATITPRVVIVLRMPLWSIPYRPLETKATNPMHGGNGPTIWCSVVWTTRIRWWTFTTFILDPYGSIPRKQLQTEDAPTRQQFLMWLVGKGYVSHPRSIQWANRPDPRASDGRYRRVSSIGIQNPGELL
jgi:hypothetical protein